MRRTPRVNHWLIGLNGAFFLLLSEPLAQAFKAVGGSALLKLKNELVLYSAEPSFHQFITYQFLHADVWHLLSNMLFLWVFGDNVEGRLGRGRFLLFYLSCGVLAALTHCMMLPNDWAPVIGASGSIAGILGAYLFLFPKARVTLLAWVVIFVTFVEVPAWLLLITYFVLQIPDVQGFLNFAGTQGIAWWAHVGGFLAGASLLPLFLLRNPRPFTKQLARQR